MIKHSRQRDAILYYLSTRKDHPTAEQVYENVRQIFPKVSMGTVYRNLSLLSEMGEISRVSVENDKSEHFDYDTSQHSHLFCRRCHGVVDMPSYDDSSEISRLTSEMKVKIESRKTIYYGICQNCLKSENMA